MLSRRVKHAEAHEKLHAAFRGVKLRQTREHGGPVGGGGRVEVGAGLLGHVGWGGRLEGAGDRVGGGEAFDAPQDDGVFVAGAGEDEVAVEGDAGGRVSELLDGYPRGKMGLDVPVDEVVVDFGGGEVRVLEDVGDVEVIGREFGKSPLWYVSWLSPR